MAVVSPPMEAPDNLGAPSSGDQGSFRAPPPFRLIHGQQPAGFWVRVLPSIIDAIVITMIHWPTAFVLAFGIGIVSGITGANISQDEQTLNVMSQLISISSYLVVAFLFYGWFYSNKGATPGKLLFGLRVVNSRTSQNLGYVRAFLREVVGKTLSTLVFFLGYVIVGFRSDKKALHDMLFSTHVIYKDVEDGQSSS